MKATELRATWDPRPSYVPLPSEIERQKARAACHVWRHPRIESVEIPTPEPGWHEVLIEVRASGICGSDTHCVETDADGYVLFSGPTALPCVLGHEYAGRIAAVGPGVHDLRVGQWVTAEGMLYCGLCEPCRRGHPNQCLRLEMVGFSSPGAYAEHIVAHEKHVFSIEPLAERLGDAQLACELAALVEPVGCSYNGMFVAGGGMAPGSHVVVFGCGPIGLGAIALARAAGAASILAFDPHVSRNEVAEALGADLALEPHVLEGMDRWPADIVRTRTRGSGADLVIEAAGAARATWPAIEGCLAPNGTVLYLGRTGDSAPIDLDALVSGAARIVGSRGHAGGGVFPNILRLLEAGRLDLGPMITARLPLSDAAAALERSKSREDGKILLVAG